MGPRSPEVSRSQLEAVARRLRQEHQSRLREDVGVSDFSRSYLYGSVSKSLKLNAATWLFRRQKMFYLVTPKYPYRANEVDRVPAVRGVR